MKLVWCVTVETGVGSHVLLGDPVGTGDLLIVVYSIVDGLELKVFIAPLVFLVRVRKLFNRVFVYVIV